MKNQQNCWRFSSLDLSIRFEKCFSSFSRTRSKTNQTLGVVCRRNSIRWTETQTRQVKSKLLFQDRKTIPSDSQWQKWIEWRDIVIWGYTQSETSFNNWTSRTFTKRERQTKIKKTVRYHDDDFGEGWDNDWRSDIDPDTRELKWIPEQEKQEN